MFTNYLKVAIRNLLKHKLYSAINVGGLAVGLACVILISLWVKDELSFDRFQKDAGSIYRVNWDFKWNGNEGVGPGTPPPLAATLVKEIPEVVATTRLFPVSQMVVRYRDRFFNEAGIVAVDSNFFGMFSFKLVAGTPASALSEPNSVVLTQATARKYFGDEPALGKMVTIGEEKVMFKRMYRNIFKVTGIVENPPRNSQIQFDLLTSMSSHPQVAFFDWSWIWMQVVTYAKLRDGVPSAIVESKIPPLVKTYAPAAFKRVGFSYDELIRSGGRWNFILQPLTDVYLGSGATGNRLGPAGSRSQVYLFSLIAVFILGIACINFMNLSTARSATRAKEIGVRKVLGSERKTLLLQFLLESSVYSCMAMPIALFLVEISLPAFNHLSGKPLQMNLFDPFWLIGGLFLLAIVVGLVAGSYPGYYLSSLKPAHTVRGGVGPSGKGSRLRNLLVAFQFAVTIGLIACTLLVKKQMDFVRQADLGFDQKGVVIISNENNPLGSRAEAFRDALKAHREVVDASISTGAPPNSGFMDYYKVEGRGEEQYVLSSYMADADFLQTLGVTIAQGRGFSREYTDSANVILNQAAVKYFGLTDPVGKTITYPSRGKYTVIGVMKDFNFVTLYSPVTPFALFNTSSQSYNIPGSVVAVRVKQDDLQGTLRMLETEWKSFVPATPFEYTFIDDRFEAEYVTAQRLGTLFLIFSLLTILIACVGLFGLSSFTTERRTKEIGVRKVLGASVREIVTLLSKDFAALVLVANLAAWPVAWYVMNDWLQDFAYRIQIGWEPFALAGLIALAIALITVSYQSVKAAISNPVEALRYE